MPIRRIPIVHKFGIISHSQRLDLQERLARKVLEENKKSHLTACVKERSLPYEIDEEFPAKFNISESHEKNDLEEKAKNILLRAKRKAGLRDGGIGGHVNLQQAWRDLSLLALCESNSVREGSLEALCQSLDQAPISRNHVTSLFKLAKHCMQWLRGEAMNEPYLRTGELKIVKHVNCLIDFFNLKLGKRKQIGHLVFLRLYYHHLAGDIRDCYRESKELFDMLQGFDDKEDVYRPFPTVLYTVRFVIQVASYLESAFKQSLKELNEGKVSVKLESIAEAEDHHAVSFSERSSFKKLPEDRLRVSNIEDSSVNLIPKGPHNTEVSLTRTTPDLLKEMSAAQSKSVNDHESEDHLQDQEPIFHELKCAVEVSKDPSLVPSIHDSCPFLWHALDVWRTVSRTGIGLSDAVDGLLSCSEDLDIDTWVDSMIAILVLSEAAKLNNTVLATFQTLGRRGIIRSMQTVNEKKKSRWIDKYRKEYPYIDTDVGVLYSSAHLEEGELDSEPSVLEQLREFLSPKPLRQQLDYKLQLPFDGQMQSGEVSPRANLTGLDPEFPKGPANQASIASDERKRPNIVEERTEKRGVIFGHQTGRSSSLSPRNMENGCHDVSTNNLEYTSSGGSLADVSSLGSAEDVDNTNKTIVKNKQDSCRRDAKSNASRKNRRKRHEKGPPSVSSQSSGEQMFSLEETQARETVKRAPLVDNIHKNHLKPNMSKDNNAAAYVTRESTVSLGTLPGVKEDTSGSTWSKTITAPPSRADGSKGWPWPLVVTYVQCLGQICIHGNTSTIQRDALTGSSGIYAGLLQLLKFQLPNQKERPNQDWSWRVRHVVVQELVKICSHYQHDALKEGLRNSAWSSLLSHHSSERDTRVLEAFKIARAGVDTMDYQLIRNKDQPSLVSRISTNLAIIHLPPIPSPVKPITIHPKKTSPQREPYNNSKKSTTVPRISIKDEIMLTTALDTKPINYKARAWKMVQEVVEDQWRKELLEENEEMEKERLKQLERQMIRLTESVNTEPLRQRIL